MSRDFVISFFPAVTSLTRPVIDWLFPLDVAQTCPEVVLATQSPIRNPCLAIGAIAGMIIGLGGAWLHRSNRLLGASFLAFGLMNASALPLHCWFPAQPSSPEQYPISWALDCFFTGWSSVCLIGLTLNWYADLTADLFNWRKQSSSKEGTSDGLRTRLKATWWITNSVASIFGLVTFVVNRRNSLLMELWYLVPVVAAGIMTAPHMLALTHEQYRHEKKVNDIMLGTLGCGVGGLVSLLSLLFDASFCRCFGTRYFDFFMAPSLFFGGCNVAFIGIALYYGSSTLNANHRSKSD